MNGGGLQPRQRFRLDCDGGQAAATPDIALVEIILELGKLAQGHRGARRGGDLKIAQGLNARALAVLGPRHDVDQIDRVAKLSDRRAADHAVECLGELFRAQAGLSHAILIDDDAQFLALLGPVVVDVAHEAG